MNSSDHSSARPDHSCPVCNAPFMRHLLTVTAAPAHVGVLWADRQSALDCPKGDVALAYCAECGFVGNVAFEAVRVAYDVGYDNALDFSAVFQDYARALASTLVERYDLRGKDVVEIGCGMGEFLKLLRTLGAGRCVGFDPSAPAEGGAVELIRDVYSERHRDLPVDLVVCRQVFEHMPTPRDFLAGLHRTIAGRGTPVFFEVPDVRNIVEELSVWDIIYEHCSYFSAESLSCVFARSGFRVVGVESLFHGQFLGVHAVAERDAATHNTAAYADARELTRLLEKFAAAFERRIHAWRARFESLRADRRTAVVWGAGARGTSFVNMLDAGGRIRYLVDINPRKHGKYVPGTGQEIVAPDRLLEIHPDLIIVMNPVYLEEIRGAARDLGVGADVVPA